MQLTDKQILTLDRLDYAWTELFKLGIDLLEETGDKIVFEYKGCRIEHWYYSGWHSGKGIKPGRGIDHLIKQLKAMDNLEGSVSRQFKQDMADNRRSMFHELKKWLKDNKIDFADGELAITVKGMVVANDMKVEFFGSSKRYQYNLSGIIKKISE